MFRFGKITVSLGFFVTPVFMLLIGAAQVLPAILFAAALHEAGHIAALLLFQVPVEEIRFTLFGAEIRADLQYLPYWKDMICTLAGPAVNLLAAFLFARLAGEYILGGANLVQGLFNLLPLTGLDGARFLQSLFSVIFGPVRSVWILRTVEIIFAVCLTAVILYVIIRHQTGGFLLLSLLGVFVGIWREMCGK